MLKITTYFSNLAAAVIMIPLAILGVGFAAIGLMVFDPEAALRFVTAVMDAATAFVKARNNRSRRIGREKQ